MFDSALLKCFQRTVCSSTGNMTTVHFCLKTISYCQSSDLLITVGTHNVSKIVVAIDKEMSVGLNCSFDISPAK